MMRGNNMALQPGTCLGPFEVLSPIGAEGWAQCIGCARYYALGTRPMSYRPQICAWLSAEMAWLTDEARGTRNYNDVRPQSSLFQLTPTEFKQSMQRRNDTARRSPGEGLRVARTTRRVRFAAQSGQSARRTCREEEALFGRANHVGPAAGGGRGARRRRVSPDGDLRADVLPLEEV